jgi:hypothetical protein
MPMNNSLTPQNKALFRLIGDMLAHEWNPLDIENADIAANEYSSYVPQVFELASIGEREKIADYLFDIATHKMGVATLRHQHLAIADRLLSEMKKIGHRSV